MAGRSWKRNLQLGIGAAEIFPTTLK